MESLQEVLQFIPTTPAARSVATYFAQSSQLSIAAFLAALECDFPTLLHDSKDLADALRSIARSGQAPGQAADCLTLRQLQQVLDAQSLDRFLAPFLLSMGTFTPTRGYRCRHFVPEPFSLRAEDREKVLLEIKKRTPKRMPEKEKIMDFCLEHGYFDIVKAVSRCATFTTNESKIGYFSEKLIVAAEEENLELCKFLVSLGADVNSFDVEWSAIYASCTAGSLDICAYLISIGGDVNYNEERTPLFVAATRGYLDICMLLVQNGADPNLKNKADGATPIMTSISKGHLDVVEYLANSGADLFVRNQQQQTLLFLAVIKGRIDCINYLLTKGLLVCERGAQNTTVLHDAANRGKLDICHVLIDNGANIDAQDDLGETALFQAAASGHSLVCDALCSRGAHIDIANLRGQTPLHIATIKGFLSVVKVLVDRGASGLTRDRAGS
ncbi:hypothetical protein HDU91_001873, partial [Kappamyces sp. JEL0680]